MLKLEVNARVRIECHARTRIKKFVKRRRLLRNELIQTFIFFRRLIFRVKVAKI